MNLESWRIWSDTINRNLYLTLLSHGLFFIIYYNNQCFKINIWHFHKHKNNFSLKIKCYIMQVSEFLPCTPYMNIHNIRRSFQICYYLRIHIYFLIYKYFLIHSSKRDKTAYRHIRKPFTNNNRNIAIHLLTNFIENMLWELLSE